MRKRNAARIRRLNKKRVNVDFDNASKEDWEEYKTKLDKEIVKKLEELTKEKKKQQEKTNWETTKKQTTSKLEEKQVEDIWDIIELSIRKAASATLPKKKKVPEIKEVDTISR